MTLPSQQVGVAEHGVGMGEGEGGSRTRGRSRIGLRSPQAVVTAGCRDAMGQAIIGGTYNPGLPGTACELEAARWAGLAGGRAHRWVLDLRPGSV